MSAASDTHGRSGGRCAVPRIDSTAMHWIGFSARTVLACMVLLLGVGIVTGVSSLHPERAIVGRRVSIPLQSAWLREEPSGRLVRLPEAFVQYLDGEIRHLAPDPDLAFRNTTGPSLPCAPGELMVVVRFATGSVVALDVNFLQHGIDIPYERLIEDPDYYYAPYASPMPSGFSRLLCRAVSRGPRPQSGAFP